MTPEIPIVLASKSEIRQSLLRNAGIAFEAIPARVDEETIKASLVSENAKPRDIVDFLAEEKAKKISNKFPEALVIGSDQIMWFQNSLIGKPDSKVDLAKNLRAFSGETHNIFTGAVIYQNGQPQWRHVSKVDMTCRSLSDSFIESYVQNHWDQVQYCAGGYMLESYGVRLFAHVKGDYFSVLGLPIIEIINYLSLRGVISS